MPVSKNKKDKKKEVEEEDDNKSKDKKNKKEFKEDYVIIAVPNSSKGTNSIHQNIYTWYSFLPKNLYKQFALPINLYFLILSILQMIPLISVSNGNPTLAVTLIFFVILTMIKDLLRDKKQRGIDSVVNNQKVEVLINNKPKDIKWSDVYPGHIIIVKEGQKIPADCILLYSSNIEKKVCYVDPNNLDGMKNLHQKNMVKYPEEIDTDNPLDYINNYVNSKIYYEPPNDDIFTFNGKMDLLGNIIPISMDNVLLRGAVLKNTNFSYCVVVYSG